MAFMRAAISNEPETWIITEAGTRHEAVVFGEEESE